MVVNIVSMIHIIYITINNIFSDNKYKYIKKNPSAPVTIVAVLSLIVILRCPMKLHQGSQ